MMSYSKYIMESANSCSMNGRKSRTCPQMRWCSSISWEYSNQALATASRRACDLVSVYAWYIVNRDTPTMLVHRVTYTTSSSPGELRTRFSYTTTSTEFPLVTAILIAHQLSLMARKQQRTVQDTKVCAVSERSTRNSSAHGHRLVGTSCLHLVVGALALLASAAFERIRFGLCYQWGFSSTA